MSAGLAAVLLAAALNAAPAIDPLPSRPLVAGLLFLPIDPGVSFDVFDARAELNEPPQYKEIQPHSIFRIRHHIGLAAGYDSGIVHGSVGFYITVAELGRWNFGVPSPEIGIARYRVYDSRLQTSLMKTQSTIIISLASVHYRGGYLRSINKNWYLNLEQIFDARANFTGSQFGISFSNP